jgi:hypothetical protein
MKPAWLTLIAGCALTVLAWIGLFGSPTESLVSPWPVLTYIPAFVLLTRFSVHMPWYSVLIPLLSFFAWNVSLFRGSARIPKRSWVLLSILTVLSVLHFVAGWGYGIMFQGREFTRMICGANLIWLALLWAGLYRWLRRPSFIGNLLFHWMVFAWLAWCAFPNLGE